MSSSDTDIYKDKIEVSLDGRQIFYLFFGGAVIASLVFILGVTVGKRVASRAQANQQTKVSVTRDPLAALDQLGDGKQQLAFPSALGDPKAANRPLGEIDKQLQHKAAAKNAQPLVAADDDGDGADKPARKDKGETAKADNKHGNANKKKHDKVAKADKKHDKVAKADKKHDKAKKKADKPARKLPRYTLQLSSFAERGEADAFMQKLTDAGYTPYMVAAKVKGKGTFYRVRLGSFMGYKEAIRAKKDFEAGQRIIAYVTRLHRHK